MGQSSRLTGGGGGGGSGGAGVALLLLTGVSTNLLGQVLVDMRWHEPQAHLMPWVKFAATLAGAALARRRRARAAPPPSRRQRRLVAAIGLLDAASYVAFCLGFFSCGASVAGLVLAAAGQLFTAAAAYAVLGRRLSARQGAGLALIGAGLAVRAAPGAAFGGSGGGLADLRPEQRAGVALVLAAAAGYTALGVAYEALLQRRRPGEPPPPAHADVLYASSAWGFAAATAYQAAYTAPRWRALVAAPAAASGARAAAVLPALAAFGALFNLHMWAQNRVFRSHGTVTVNVVTAARGAALAVLGGHLFCSPAAPWRCLSVQAAASAAVTTAGALVYILAPPPPGEAKPAAKRA